MHKKAVENDWFYDFTQIPKIVQIYESGIAAFFVPDYQFYYFFAEKIKRGDDQNMMKTRVCSFNFANIKAIKIVQG